MSGFYNLNVKRGGFNKVGAGNGGFDFFAGGKLGGVLLGGVSKTTLRKF